MSEAIDIATSVAPGIGVDERRGGYRTLRLVMGLVFVISTVIAALTLPGDTAGGWGMFTATWLFLLSVSMLGVVFTAIMRVTGGLWARPIFRLAEVTTLAYMPLAFAGLLVIFYAARDQLFFWISPEPGAHLSPWLSESGLLIRNLLGLGLFYFASAVYVRRAVSPDLADVSGSASGFLQKLVAALFGGTVKRTPEQLTGHLYRFAIWLLLIASLAATFVAWDFAMMLWPHYHSTVFTLYFMEGCIYGGIALLLLLTALLRRYKNMEPVFGTRQVKNIGIMLTAFMCLWLYFFWAQYFVSWFGNLPHEMRPLDAQMKGHYAPLFWVSVACLFALPLALLIFAKVKRRLWSASIVAGLILVGVFLNRYLMVLPARWDHHLPFSTIGGSAGSIALISGFLFLLLLLFDAFPMLSRWEIEEIPASQRGHWHSET